MKTKLVQLGHSRGVRIPKALLEQTGIQGDVTIEARGDAIVIRGAHRPREGWEEAARAFAEAGGDDAEWTEWSSASMDDWDESEWTW